MEERSSPGTSDIIRDAAPHRIPDTSCPPLIPERCLRTQLSWCIGAPDSRSSRLTSLFSSSEIPAGRHRRDDDPPETRNTTKSELRLRARNLATSKAASTLD